MERQLESCGLERFDFCLMHARNADNYEKYKACKACAPAFRLKAVGKFEQ